MTWWTILKNIKGPYTPVEFQTKEEIEDIIESRIKREKIYGATPDYDINLGNLRTLNELRAGYFLPKKYRDSKKLTEVTEITFRLLIEITPLPYVLKNRIIRINQLKFEIWTDEFYNIQYKSNEKDKVARDWAELYSKPNHEYKNIKADYVFVDNADMRIGETNFIKERLLKSLIDNIDILSTIKSIYYGDLYYDDKVEANKVLSEKTIDTKIPTYNGGTYRLGMPGNEEYRRNIISRTKNIRGVKL